MPLSPVHGCTKCNVPPNVSLNPQTTFFFLYRFSLQPLKLFFPFFEKSPMIFFKFLPLVQYPGPVFFVYFLYYLLSLHLSGVVTYLSFPHSKKNKFWKYALTFGLLLNFIKIRFDFYSLPVFSPWKASSANARVMNWHRMLLILYKWIKLKLAFMIRK